MLTKTWQWINWQWSDLKWSDANWADWIMSLVTAFVGEMFLLFLLAWIGTLLSKHRRASTAYVFCLGLVFAYAMSFAFNILALTLLGPITAKHAFLPFCVWLLAAVISLYIVVLFSSHTLRSSAFWAYLLIGAIAMLPALLGRNVLINSFTALPLFVTALVLQRQKITPVRV